MKLNQKDIEKMLDDDNDYLDNQDVVNSRIAKIRDHDVKSKREENAIYHEHDAKRNPKKRF